MEQSKGLADRVEKWMARIPGVRSYREREQRRETDKELRAQWSSRLQATRSSLKKVILEAISRGRMESLPRLDRLSSSLQRMADTLQYASYGYGGIFDLEKIREEELDRLYAFDLSLAEDLERIQAKIDQLSAEPSGEAQEKRVEEAEAAIDLLERKVLQRKDFMSFRPAGF